MRSVSSKDFGHLRREGRHDIAVHILDLSDHDRVDTHPIVDEGRVARDHLSYSRLRCTKRHGHRRFDRTTKTIALQEALEGNRRGATHEFGRHPVIRIL